MLLYIAKYYDKGFVLHFEDDDEETEMVRSVGVRGWQLQSFAR